MRLVVSNFPILLCGALLLVLTGAGVLLPQPVIGVYGIGYGAALDHFVALTVVQSVIYAGAVVIMLRMRAANLWLILGIAALLRLAPLIAPPFLSSDIFRYVWDGWVQRAGINPYRYIPADPHLTFLRDAAVYPHINRATYAHTIYPPAAEMLFFLASSVTKIFGIAPVFGMKLLMLACEAAGMWAIILLLDLAHLPRGRVLIYAWNPLPVWEFANNGHVDAIAIPLIAFSLLLAVRSKRAASAAVLAAATLTKFLPILLAPVLWRRWDWKFAGAFLACVVLLYLPYLQAGRGVLGFLPGYGAQEGISDGTGIFLLSALGLILPLPAFAAKLYLAALAGVLLVLAALIVFRSSANPSPRALCRNAMLIAGAAMLGLSPHYPWYYAWLLIPACILPAPCVLYLTSCSFLLYLNPTHTNPFWPALLYLPFISLAARDLWSARAPATIGLALAEGKNP